MHKRVVSAMLALCIILTLMPVYALAEQVDSDSMESVSSVEEIAFDETTEGQPEEELQESVPAPYVETASGTCGPNLTWTLDADETLTISGNGPMYDYRGVDSTLNRQAPWAAQRNDIQKVDIENGVTCIGNYALAFCNLISVTIPKSMTSIGLSAFETCKNLSSITIPDGVTSIGDLAFSRCTSLNSITIPKSMTKIGSNAFQECTNLTSVTISDGLPCIELATFFYCKNLTSITIPKSVSSIEQQAFDGCDALSDVYYSGTKAQWQEITIERGNDPLTTATIHFNDENQPAPPQPTPSDEEIRFRMDTNSVSVGDELSITASMSDPSGLQASDITWSSSNEDIATVTAVSTGSLFENRLDATARVRGISPGTATITVTLSDGRSAGCKITVKETSLDSGIAVFTTEKSLTVQTGKSMWLGFGKLTDGQMLSDWEKMAIVVSDPTVISLSEYEETEYGYSLEVTGKKQGTTNVTITDTASGSSIIIVITVWDSYTSTYSYSINDIGSFYPNNRWEDAIQTNIYNLNGLYVNNYHCDKNRNTYAVSFDVYNSNYHTGAVDIYDADGNWIDCEEIKKFSSISSLWDTGEQAYYLVSDAFTGKLLTYEQASSAAHTPISIEVPDGGYFTISNNFSESPGTFLFNSCEIVYEATCTLIDAAKDVKNNDVILSEFSKLVKDEIKKDKTIREQFIEIFKKTVKKEAKKYFKNFLISEIDERYAGISGLFENLLNSLNISWKHLFQSATGVVQSAFNKFAGPAGIALKGCFALSGELDQLMQAVDIATSLEVPYATVFSNIDEGSINSHGVVVNTNGNIDAEAVLQVFGVSNDDTIEVVLGEGPKTYELYNICFVKNDQLVQPSGKVTVRIPIPDGMNGNTCSVYRQESDGTWTILTAHIEDNYLVFETDHFSLYGVVGEVNNLSILTMPSKTQYNVGDILETDGLVLSLDGQQITDGFVCEPTVLSQEGEQKVTVQYGFASTDFTVVVFKELPPESYIITYDSNGGTGTMADGTVTQGQPFILPSNGFTAPSEQRFKAWLIGTTEYQPGDKYTFTADATVKAVWENTPPETKATYTIIITANPTEGGSVTGGGDYVEGTSVTVSATANSGYRFVRWTENGQQVNTEAVYTFTVERNRTLAAVFERISSGTSSSGGGGGTTSRITSSTITIGSTNYGSVTASPKNAGKGTTVTLTVRPNSGYVLESMTVKDTTGTEAELTKLSDTKYTFTMPGSRVTVNATFISDGSQRAPASTQTFYDIPASHWASTEINWALAKGIMNGTGNGAFSPDNRVTRQQTWMVLGRFAGINPANMAEAKSWAVNNSISDGTNPGNSLTRQQLVALLYRYAQLKGYATTGGVDISTYPDNTSIAAYAKDAMSWAVGNGIIAGTSDGCLNPGGTATRAQFAVIMYRFNQKIVG